jgi:hypothetical protein
MSNEPIDPEDIASDGVQEDQKPVPRDDAGRDAASPAPENHHAAGGAATAGSAGTARGTSDTQKVPGPAEEQDEKTADDRGLTTDTTPD